MTATNTDTAGRPLADQPTLALGCWSFGGAQWAGQEDADSRAAMGAALEHGVTHFDTATDYGGGRSEKVVGEFARGRRDRLYLASKFNCSKEPTPEQAVAAVDKSLERLGTEFIDLYYLHWPKSGIDIRPAIEGLDRARGQGKIGAVGVSNFSVDQLESVGAVARIDALQICYNLFWRFADRDVLPYCRDQGIDVVTYSSLAQGVLTGKFPENPEFDEGDVRNHTVHFEDAVWPHVYAGVERLRPIAEAADRPIAHLAIQWAAAQPGVSSVLVGARNAEQMTRNAQAMANPVGEDVLAAVSAVGDDVMQHVPDVGNMFRYYP